MSEASPSRLRRGVREASVPIGALALLFIAFQQTRHDDGASMALLDKRVDAVSGQLESKYNALEGRLIALDARELAANADCLKILFEIRGQLSRVEGMLEHQRKVQ